MNIILLGAPGTGKGTQSALLAAHFDLYHISTGDVFRRALSQNTSLGKQARAYMDRGDLVPDSIVSSMVGDIFASSDFKAHTKGFILDGFPRTIAQAKSLDALLREYQLHLDKVIHLQVSESVLMDRITGRRVAAKSGKVYHILFHPPKKAGVCDITGEELIHRKDDTKKVVQRRLKTYHKQTKALIDYYQKLNLLKEIDGNGKKEEVLAGMKTLFLQK